MRQINCVLLIAVVATCFHIQVAIAKADLDGEVKCGVSANSSPETLHVS